jgi:hypothetical protein
MAETKKHHCNWRGLSMNYLQCSYRNIKMMKRKYIFFFFDRCLPIGEIQHPFGIRNVFNVSFWYLIVFCPMALWCFALLHRAWTSFKVEKFLLPRDWFIPSPSNQMKIQIVSVNYLSTFKVHISQLLPQSHYKYISHMVSYFL